MKLKSTGKPVVVQSAGYRNGGTDPDIVALDDGRMVMVWTETLGQPTDVFDDTDGGVFGRILDADGNGVGEIFQINVAQTFAQDRPHVVAINGGFAVAWTSSPVYGDHPGDPDTFLRFFNNDGVPSNAPIIDIVPDGPSLAQDLREMVSLSGNRFAVILEDNTSHIYNHSGIKVAQLSPRTDDMAQLENGNIVRASVAGNHIDLIVTDTTFEFGPTGISGIYEPLTFYVDGESETNLKGDLELAALAGGGFVLAFVEEQPLGTAKLRLAVISDECAIEAKSMVQFDFSVDNLTGEFDMIALSGGGFALALVTSDANGIDTGLDLMLFDANGKMKSQVQAGMTDADSQGNPSLTELPDGRIALAFTDMSGAGILGGEDPLRVAFFDVSEPRARFQGTQGNDDLGGVGGNDRIWGLGGDDIINGRDGDDRLFGNDGADTLIGGAGDDSLRGGAGNDQLKGGSGNDGLGGGSGDDRLWGQSGNDVLGGGDGDDRLWGQTGKDVLKGGDGNDRLWGQAGNDVLYGGDGDDRLFGGDGNDVLKGGQGSDVLNGGQGRDTFVFVKGHSGTDQVEDFNAAQDIISLELRGMDPTAVTVSVAGGDTEIAFGDNLVTLLGVTLNETDITFQFL